MASHRFHCATLACGLNRLGKEETHHVAVTLRLRCGDAVVLFDGSGREGVGLVERIDRRIVSVRVSTIHERPFDVAYRITLAVAMAKAHRQGYLIEKCTELGVAEIWPIFAERSVTRPDEAAVDKWSRRAIEAAKQSGRSWVPVIEKPRSFEEAVSLASGHETAVITDPDEKGIAFLSFLAGRRPKSAILVFVGPEGGWSDAERKIAGENGIKAVRLAPAILRAETAAVAVCAAVSLFSVGGPAGESRGKRGADDEPC